ncbi:MAG: peptidase M20, partial [Planctomycetota bacterium]
MSQTEQTASSSLLTSTLERLQSSRDRHREELVDWLRIPSVSSDSSRRDDTCAAGHWLRNKFESAGLTCRQIDTDGFPLIYAETPPVPGQ